MRTDEIRENKEEIQHMFWKIGDTLVQVLPNNWNKVVLGYFLEGVDQIPHQQILFDSISHGDFTDLMDEMWDNEDLEDIILALGDICNEIHDHCNEHGDRWYSMTFIMASSGEFTIEYAYDAIEKYDTHFILDWQSKYLD